ncbi:MAG: hypothetical protein JWO86_1872 [Myxococcaceae bacterium]|nr:hypothetical protein [Myxococcaceae bacterium]
MALFPDCSFQVLLPGGVLMPGTRVDGTLVVEAPEPIPRAEHVDLVFQSVAWAGYASGKSREVERRTMFDAPLHVDLAAKALPAGRHEFPFSIDVPTWLPPNYAGNDCGIEHLITMRLDVDWAVDRVSKIVPIVGVLPRSGTRAALTTRSPGGFHDEIVLEVMLASAVIVHDEPLVGQVALRSGHGARFDAIELLLGGSARIAMGRGDRRRGGGSMIRIPADKLRGGEAVPFTFPANQHFPPSFASSFIDHDVVLTVSADITWATDPSFDLLLDVLPAGSTIVGETSTSIVGAERLRRIGAAMAESTGLREARAPMLVSGDVAGVGVRISDAPRAGSLGIDVDLVFPDVELGIAFRPLGALEGFRTSPLLAGPLGDRYLLRCAPSGARPAVDDAAVSNFVRSLLGDATVANDIRFSDHHLGVHIPIPNDELPRMVDIARAAYAKAKTIGDAIAALPFPAALSAARPAWQATAAEQNAFLVPTGPSLHGLVFRTRVLAGEERTIGASLRTRWTKDGPTIHVDVDLRNAPLPKAAWAELESATPSERLRAVRALFPSAHVLAQGNGATLDRPEWAADPRALLSAIETFFAWVLDTRGERRTDLPYR